MAIYEYKCLSGHVTEHIRKFDQKYEMTMCHCGYLTFPIEISHGHVPPSGVYSYLPNLGSARDFERRQNALETGQKVIKRTFDDG